MRIAPIIKDIRFWIILFFALRLFNITSPPYEVAHHWRQTTVTMVARNFVEVDNNILYPRMDIAGEKTGITGMEFPLLNYMIYGVSELFGYQHWYGRLINLIVSSLGLWFFFRLLRRYFDERISFMATMILLFSIWFQFSRKIMPDTFAMSLVIAGMYYGTNYLDPINRKHQYLNLTAYTLLISLGVLSKLPAAFILAVFAIFIFSRNIKLDRKLIFITISVVGLVPAVLWYFYWVPILFDKYEFHHFFMGKSIITGYQELIDNLGLTLSRFYDTALKYIGFAAFVYGLVWAILRKEKVLILVFLLSFVSFVVIMLKAGFTFSHHTYYIIPFTPVMALVASYGLSRVKCRSVALVILALIAIEGVSNQFNDFVESDRHAGLLTLEEDLDRFSDRRDLILINSGKYPTPMYFAHRKGWVNSNEMIKQEGYLLKLEEKGLKYIVILKTGLANEVFLNQYDRIFENDDYAIYAVD